MSTVTVAPVQTPRDFDRFVRLPFDLYRNDPYWVPPLISEEYKKLNKNSTFFTIGEAEYFLAFQDGRPVGRISAHINHQYEKYQDQETGFFGFFECINDQKVADGLLDAASEYLRGKGKKRILGPMSFCIYDISGVLYEGFDSSPVILLAYNPPYYNDLLTQTGFKKAIDWYAFLVTKEAPIRPELFKVKERILRQKDLQIVPLNMKEFDDRVRDVGHIFAEAWMENWGHVPLTERQIQDFAEELKLVVVPEVTYFAFYKGECIGFSLSIKDINPALKKANGRLFPFGLIKILLASRKLTRLRTIAMGVLKEHRHRGIDIAFYLKTIEEGTRLGYVESECSIIVETNHRMIGALEDLSAKRYKTYRFYEKPIA